MIDSEGYRANIGIVITNDKKQILLAKRYKQDAWQLPQGGIDKGCLLYTSPSPRD